MPIPITVTLEIKKFDREQRKAYGWVSIVEDADGQPIIDHEGHVIPIGVLEKAVHAAVATGSGAGKGGDLHERRGLLDVVETVVVTAEKRKAEGSPFAPEGPAGWWAGFGVNDDDTWSKIKGGERPELSLRGSGEGVQLAKRDDGEKREAKILISKIDLNAMEWFSTVDRGAAGDGKPEHRPRIILWKRKQERDTMTVADLIKSLEGNDDAIELAKKLDLAKQMTPELLEILTALKPEQQAVVLKAIEDAKGPGAAPEPPAPEPGPGSPPPPPDMAKRKDIPEDVRVYIAKRAEADEAAETERVELQKRIDKIEDDKLTLEISKRVSAEMPYLPGKPEEWIELIKSLRKGIITSEQAADIEAHLVTVSKAMKASPHLKALGVDGGDGGTDAIDEAMRLAKALQEKDPNLSDSKALDQVYRANVPLYKRVKEEAAAS